ncbi:MAG: hypothetical protein MJY79_02070 [Bacteroidaceae bacterium]|nr:hypothetical protein [Bacteroidaceae bacterium]
MDETSTQSIEITSKLLRAAMKGMPMVQPKQKTIDFLKVLAGTFKAVDCMPDEASAFSLN